MTVATVTLPDEFIEQIAQRVAAILAECDSGSPWMTRAEAADYMSVPVSRLEKAKNVPYVKDGGRVLYHRGELDAFLLACREGDWTSKP